VAERQTDRQKDRQAMFPHWGLGPHMEVGDVLPVQGLGDGELARDGADDVDARGGLVGPGARHAVAQETVIVPVRTDLRHRRVNDTIMYSPLATVGGIHLPPSLLPLSAQRKPPPPGALPRERRTPGEEVKWKECTM
jgi:hypothetical protein